MSAHRLPRDLTPLPEQADDLLAMGICPDCAMPGCLVDGPRGGMMQNVACRSCGSEFNIGRFRGEIVISHRNTEPGEPNRDRLRKVFGIELP